MVIKKVLIISCITLLSACSSTDNDNVESDVNKIAATDNSDLRCEKVTVTGSRFPVRRCTTAAQRAREAEDAKKVLNDARIHVGSQN